LPKIVITNDDGIYSPGILALKKVLEKLGETLVIAPKKETSGIGKAISSRLIKIENVTLADGSKAYAIEGTPADAFLLAIYKFLKQKPDLLVTGINIGPNLGIDDFFTSGTLGAAIEAAIHGTPAIAVSYCLEKFFEGQNKASLVDMKKLESTAEIAGKISKYILENGMPSDVDIISVNVPEKPKEWTVEVTRLSNKGYKDLYSKREDGYIINSWVLDDYPDDVLGTDLYAVKVLKRISITPIKLNFKFNVDELRELLEILNAKS